MSSKKRMNSFSRKNWTLSVFLLLAGSLALGACDFVRGNWATRGHLTLFNNTGASLEVSVPRQNAVQVESGSHVRMDTEYLRVNFLIRKGNERFLYNIPFDIWETHYTDGSARDLRLRIDDSMRVYLAPPDRAERTGALPDQPKCFPLIPIGEWLRSDVRVHSVEPSRRSRYMYGTLPRPLGPPIGGDALLGPTIWIKVLLKDADSGYVGRALVTNDSFARKLWWLSQESAGREVFTAPTAEFIQDHYVPFMQEHEDRPIEMRVRAFGGSVLRWNGLCKDDSPADPFPRLAPYTLSELGFADRDELIAALFDFNEGAGTGIQRPETIGEVKFGLLDRRFISLLIDLGLVVEVGAERGLRITIIE